MRTLLTSFISLQLLGIHDPVPGQKDSVCRQYCQTLAVKDGIVRFMDLVPPPRNLPVGQYIEADQFLVPAIEAPIRDLRSQNGWRIVVSAFLHHDPENEGEAGLRLRFFASDAALRATDDILMELERSEIGRFFGGTDEVFIVTSNEEHAYNVETEIWLLPQTSNARRLLWIRGSVVSLRDGGDGKSPGAMVTRQTYDGVHADTKGTVQEFYTWDREKKLLEKPGNKPHVTMP